MININLIISLSAHTYSAVSVRMARPSTHNYNVASLQPQMKPYYADLCWLCSNLRSDWQFISVCSFFVHGLNMLCVTHLTTSVTCWVNYFQKMYISEHCKFLLKQHIQTIICLNKILFCDKPVIINTGRNDWPSMSAH